MDCHTTGIRVIIMREVITQNEVLVVN